MSLHAEGICLFYQWFLKNTINTNCSVLLQQANFDVIYWCYYTNIAFILLHIQYKRSTNRYTVICISQRASFSDAWFIGESNHNEFKKMLWSEEFPGDWKRHKSNIQFQKGQEVLPSQPYSIVFPKSRVTVPFPGN